MLFIFEGGPIETESQLQLPEAELSEVRYFDQEQLPTALNERLTRRVTEAINAQGSQTTRYLEHGLPHSSGVVPDWARVRQSPIGLITGMESCPGTVSPGSASGATRTSTPSARRTSAVP